MTYGYQVMATTSDGSHSDYSTPPVHASTFGPAFSSTLNVNLPALDGSCIVQRIEHLVGSGNYVRITVRGSTVAPLLINQITIAEAAPLPADPYDSAAPPVPLLEGKVYLDADEAYTTRAVEFPLNLTKALLIAFDIGSPGNIRYVAVPQSEAAMYFKKPVPNGPPVAEAGMADRTGYTLSIPSPGMSTVCLIERIEIATIEGA
jgi:hypothetical protein